MKKNEDKGKFFIGLLLTVAAAAWIFLVGFHPMYLVVLLVGLVLMLFSRYRIV